MSQVIVNNITEKIQTVLLKSFFDRYGACVVIEHKGSSAIVEFKREESAQNAVKNMNNTNLFGLNGEKSLSVSLKQSQPPSMVPENSLNSIGGNQNLSASGNPPSNSGVGGLATTRHPQMIPEGLGLTTGFTGQIGFFHGVTPVTFTVPSIQQPHTTSSFPTEPIIPKKLPTSLDGKMNSSNSIKTLIDLYQG